MLLSVVIPSSHSSFCSLPLGHFSMAEVCWDTTPLSSLGSCPATDWLGVTLDCLSWFPYSPTLPWFVRDDRCEELKTLSTLLLALRGPVWTMINISGPLGLPCSKLRGQGKDYPGWGLSVWSAALLTGLSFFQRAKQPQLGHSWNMGDWERWTGKGASIGSLST